MIAALNNRVEIVQALLSRPDLQLEVNAKDEVRRETIRVALMFLPFFIVS